MATKREIAQDRLDIEIQKGVDSAKDIYQDEVPLSYQYGWLKGVARGFLVELEVYKEEIDRLRDKVDELEDKINF
mgnify:CR=1 FL=1